MRKNLLKSILFLVLSFLMAVSFAGCDCKGCKENEGPSASTIDLYFSSDEINLTIDDSRRLDVFVDGVMQNPADVKFGSENPNVVTINDAGEVTGYAPGSTYVTASMQGATAKCLVNVDLLGLAPEIVFVNADYDKYSQIAIPSGDELDMAANISFNGKIFDDAEFSYELSDKTLGSVSGTKFTANKTTGELQISVIAKWRGVTVEEKVINVVLTNSLSMTVNGEPFSTINTTAVVLNKAGAMVENKFDLNVEIKDRISEEPLDVNIVLENHYKNIINYNSWNSEITTIQIGTAYIDVYLRRADGSNGAFLRNIKIIVNPYIFENEKADQVYLFDAADGNFDVDSIFGGNVKVAGAEFIERDIKISADENGAVLGVTTDGKVEPTAEYVNVYNKQYGYRVQVKAYGKIVDTPEDLLWFNFSTDGSDYSSSKMNVKTLTGYYIMTNDIDMSKVDFSKIPTITDGSWQNETGSGKIATLGFQGTFDGNGYSIYNMKGIVGGIFGILNGTVKDLAFRNVILEKVVDAKGAERTVSLLASRMFNATNLENIYVEVPTVESTNYSLLSNVVSSDISGKNIVVILNTDKITSNCSPLSSKAIRATVGYGYSYGSDNPFNKMQNVIIVTGIPLGTLVNNANKADGSGIYRMEAANVSNLDIEVPFTFLDSNVLNYTAIKNSTLYRFNNLDELSQNKNAISNILDKFSENENWLISDDGIVYWANDYIVEYNGLQVVNNSINHPINGENKLSLVVKNAAGEVISENVTYSVPENNGVVALEGANLVVTNKGVTTLTVKVGDNEVIDIAVRIHNPIVDRTNETIILDADGEEFTITGEEILSGSVLGGTVNVDGNKISLSFEEEAKSANKEYVVSFETEDYLYNYTVKYVTAYIKTVDEFKSVFGYTSDVNTSTIPSYKGYYLLANNLDFAGVTFDAGFANTAFVANTDALGLTGTFDGDGYVTYNLTAPKGGVFGIINGTVKNVAFVNADVNLANQTGILATYMGSKAVFENVYLTYNGDYSTNKAMISYYGNIAGLKIKNSYFQGNAPIIGATATSSATTYQHINFTSDSNFIAVTPYGISRRGTNSGGTKDGAAAGSTTTLALGTTSSAGNLNDDGDYACVYRYVSVDEMVDTYTKGETIIDGVPVDMSVQKENLIAKLNAWDKTYFDVSEDGKLSWKNDLTSYTVYVNDAEVKDNAVALSINGDKEIGLKVKDGASNVLDNKNITYVLTCADGSVSISANDPAILVINKMGTATLTVKIGNAVISEITINVTKDIIDRTSEPTVLLDANGEEFTIADGTIIGGIVSGGTVVVNGNNIALSFEDEAAAANKEYVVGFETENAIYNYKVKYVTAYIRTAEEFVSTFALAKGDLTTASTLEDLAVFNGYYVLANNIDFAGKAMPTETFTFSKTDHYMTDSGAFAKTKGLSGTFDGNGYAIYNVKAPKGGLFGIIGGTVKNVAFINIDIAEDANGGLLAAMIAQDGKLSNVYIDYSAGYKASTYAIANLSRYQSYAVLDKVYVSAEIALFDNVVYSHNAANGNAGKQYGSTFDNANFIYISKQSPVIGSGTYRIYEVKGNKSADNKPLLNNATATVGNGGYVTLGSANSLRFNSVNAEGDAFSLVSSYETYKTIIDGYNGEYFEVGPNGKIAWVKDTASYAVFQDNAKTKDNIVELQTSGIASETVLSVKNLADVVVEGYSYELSNNDGVVALDGAKLTAKKEGTATLTVKKGDVVWFTLTVEVAKPVVQKDLVIEVEQDSAEGSEDGVLTKQKLASIFGEDSNTVVAVKSLDDELVLELDGENRIIFKDKEGNPFVATSKSYKAIIYNDTYGVELSIMPITKIIRTATDLLTFRLVDTEKSGINNDIHSGKGPYNNTLADLNEFDGYYVLNNNIDASSLITEENRLYSWGYKFAAHEQGNDAIMLTKGLTGTFDGRGYTISNLKLYLGGLFGIVNGTVKNVAFVQPSHYMYYGTLIGLYSAVIAQRLSSTAVLENVAIYEPANNFKYIVAQDVTVGVKFTNCYFEAPNCHAFTMVALTSANYGRPRNNTNFLGESSNLVIVSPYIIGGASSSTSFDMQDVTGNNGYFDSSSTVVSGATRSANTTAKRYQNADDLQTRYLLGDSDTVATDKSVSTTKTVINAIENAYFNVDKTTGAITWANRPTIA